MKLYLTVQNQWPLYMFHPFKQRFCGISGRILKFSTMFPLFPPGSDHIQVSLTSLSFVFNEIPTGHCRSQENCNVYLNQGDNIMPHTRL